jgi:hypothetical protein
LGEMGKLRVTRHTTIIFKLPETYATTDYYDRWGSEGGEKVLRKQPSCCLVVTKSAAAGPGVSHAESSPASPASATRSLRVDNVDTFIIINIMVSIG